MEKMFNEIGEMCIDKGIKIADIPDFVYDLLRNTTPFSGSGVKNSNKEIKAAVNFGHSFHYDVEARNKSHSIE